MYSQGGVKHDPERVAGFATMRRLETAGELMQFLKAGNWLHMSLPRMSEVVWPLQVFLEERMVGAKGRTKRGAGSRAIAAGEWTLELNGAWNAAEDVVAHAVALTLPKKGWAVLIIPDASDEHWGSFLTQMPQEKLDRGVLVEDMTHELLRFLSGTKGSQQRWTTVNKEGFAMVSTFKRLEYLLWNNGVHIYTDHRNLSYIFDPEVCVSSVARTTMQRSTSGRRY